MRSSSGHATAILARETQTFRRCHLCWFSSLWNERIGHHVASEGQTLRRRVVGHLIRLSRVVHLTLRSAFGTLRTLMPTLSKSALGGEADMARTCQYVR